VRLARRPHQPHRYGLFLTTLTQHGDLDRLSRLLECHPLLQLGRVVHRLAVHGDDHIAGLDAGFARGGIVARVAVHHDAADLLQTHGVGVLLRASWMATPMTARSTRPVLTSWSITVRARFIGMAKP